MATFNEFEEDFARVFNDIIDQDILNANTLSDLGDDIVTRIVTRSRRGFGVARNGGRQRRLRPLSPGYIEQRREARSAGLLSNFTSPARSNVTFSGNMLNSIIYRTNKNSDGETFFLTIEFDNSDAAEAAIELHANGRPFFFLTGGDINRVTREVNSLIRNLLVDSINSQFR